MVKLVMVSSGNDSLVIVQSSSSKSVECYPAGHSWFYSCDLDLSAIWVDSMVHYFLFRWREPIIQICVYCIDRNIIYLHIGAYTRSIYTCVYVQYFLIWHS